MITHRIKSLFQFIEFLHSNTENFKRYEPEIKELHLLGKKRKGIKRRINFVEKLKYDEVQAEIKDKFKVIDENIIQAIKSKVLELNICDWNNTITLWNYNISEINSLKENFSKNDVPKILLYKNQYLKFRAITDCNYFQSAFFSDLDETLKELFDFFKDNDKNEFEAFETKPVEVNSIAEVPNALKTGKGVVSIPFDLIRNKNPNEKVKFIGTFLGFKGLDKIDSFFNKKFQNWLYRNSHTKEHEPSEFDKHFTLNYDDNGNITNATFSHTTKDGIPLTEKDFISIELKHLSLIDTKEFNLDDKKRIEFYKEYLSTKNTVQPQQWEKDKIDEVKVRHNNIFKNNAFEVWQSMFEAFNIKESSRTDIRFMFDTMKTDGLIHNTVSQKNILDWINDTYQLVIEKPTFKNFKTDNKRNAIYSTAKQVYKNEGA